MLHAMPEAAAPALVVTRLIFQRPISQRCHTVRRNKLPLARRKPLSVRAPTLTPLRRRIAHLIPRRNHHSLEIIAGNRQRFLQIHLLPLVIGQRLQLSRAPHIRPRQISDLPIPQLGKRLLSQPLRRLGCGLRRIRGLILFRRWRSFLRWSFLRRSFLRRCRRLRILWLRSGRRILRILRPCCCPGSE